MLADVIEDADDMRASASALSGLLAARIDGIEARVRDIEDGSEPPLEIPFIGPREWARCDGAGISSAGLGALVATDDVFIVVGDAGEYGDHVKWNASCHPSKAEAEAWAEHLNRIVSRGDWSLLRAADPRMNEGSAIEYSVDPVPMLRPSPARRPKSQGGKLE